MTLGTDILNPVDKMARIQNKAYMLQMMLLDARASTCCVSTEDMSEKDDVFTCNKCGRKWEIISFEHDAKMVCVG